LSLYNGKPDKIKDKLIASMNSMKDLEDYIEKTEDSSLGMIVEVVKEFGNRLPELINELKTNHTAKKEDADMIFSTVHRCKGMEYDEVTLLNDFINEEKLKKYIGQLGGDNMKAADQNRLEEEINILYVAVTRAKNKLKIPAEINPLHSIELAGQQQVIINTSNKYQRSNTVDDWKIYSRAASKVDAAKTADKPGNYGKRWSPAEEETLEQLYLDGIGLHEIAVKLGRGKNGVRIKLVNLGLMDEGDEF
jgi:superfamily I DNA/RNA helicase